MLIFFIITYRFLLESRLYIIYVNRNSRLKFKGYFINMDTNILLLVGLLVLGFFGFRFLTKEDSKGTASKQPEKPSNIDEARKKQMDELFRLPKSAKTQEEAQQQDDKLAQLRYRSPENSVNGAIEKIKDVEPKFNIKDFIKGAQTAFIEITQAFAEGNREFIRLRANEYVFYSFDKAISERFENHQHLEIDIKDFKIIDIIRAKIDNGIAKVKVKFVTHQTSVLKDQYDNIIAGESDNVQEFRDIWTFERKIGSHNPNWILVHTAAEN